MCTCVGLVRNSNAVQEGGPPKKSCPCEAWTHDLDLISTGTYAISIQKRLREARTHDLHVTTQHSTTQNRPLYGGGPVGTNLWVCTDILWTRLCGAYSCSPQLPIAFNSSIHCGSSLQIWWSQLIFPWSVQLLCYCVTFVSTIILTIQSSCISHLYLPMLKSGCNFIEKQLPLSGVWKPLLYMSCSGITSGLAPSNIYSLELLSIYVHSSNLVATMHSCVLHNII